MKSQKNNSGSITYILGMIGAAYYYISTASGFTAGLIGLVKAIFWPGVLVYEVLKYMGG